MAAFDSKKSEKLQDDIWSDIDEPPVDGPIMYHYAVIFHVSGHYYLGGLNGMLDSNNNDILKSVLRLQTGSWTWSIVGRINSARSAHAVTLVGEKFIVVGGSGNYKNEACLLDNGQLNCTELSSSLDHYSHQPILFTVADNYGSC